jgi:integrase
MGGERYGKSGYKTKREAADAEAAHKRKIKKQSRQTITVTDFKTIAYEYLDLSKRKHALKTYKQKTFVCKSFLEHTGNLPIDQITASHLHSYLNTRPTNNNYNAHRKDLCSVFTHAKKVMKVITYNPCWDLDKMPHTPDEKYIPPEEDILKLIMAADPKTDEKDLILTLIHTAARIDEILRLKWKDVNLTKKTMTRWTKKRRGGAYEPIISHMNEKLYSIMKRLWEARKNETWVFYNEKTGGKFNHRPKLMKGLCKRAGIEPAFGFHNIRHFIASYLADTEKISKKAIGGLLGHKALQTTEIYLHSADQSEADALDRLAAKF